MARQRGFSRKDSINIMNQTTGLILRLRALGESDILVDLFTRGLGRATALAKGGKRSKKRFFGLLLTGHYLSLQLAPAPRGGDLWRLDSASLENAHLGLRRDYRRFLAAGPVLELLLRGAAVHDPQPEALDLALLTLARMERASVGRETASALVVFLVRLLSEMGYGLNLGECVHCGRPYQQGRGARLSPAGGLVCGCRPPERGSVDAPPGLVKGLAAGQGMEAPALSRLSLPQGLLAPALAFLSEFWRRVIGHDLSSLEAARAVLDGP